MEPGKSPQASQSGLMEYVMSRLAEKGMLPLWAGQCRPSESRPRRDLAATHEHHWKEWSRQSRRPCSASLVEAPCGQSADSGLRRVRTPHTVSDLRKDQAHGLQKVFAGMGEGAKVDEGAQFS